MVGAPIPSFVRTERLAAFNSTHWCVRRYNRLMNTLFDGIPEFVAVARLGSFTRAAGELGVTKSAAGRAVSRLEARLGAKLLHRTTRRLTLTADGEIWLAHCVAVLAELDRGAESLTMARSEPSGRLRIDLPSAFGRLYMMPLLIDLAKQYPALMLSVSFTDRRVDLIGEGIDLAVRIGVLDDSPDLVARPLGVQQLVICATPAYLSEHGSPDSAEDLAEHDCITGWRSELQAAWLLKQPDGTTAPHIIKVKHEFLDYQQCSPAGASWLDWPNLASTCRTISDVNYQQQSLKACQTAIAYQHFMAAYQNIVRAHAHYDGRNYTTADAFSSTPRGRMDHLRFVNPSSFHRRTFHEMSLKVHRNSIAYCQQQLLVQILNRLLSRSSKIITTIMYRLDSRSHRFHPIPPTRIPAERHGLGRLPVVSPSHTRRPLYHCDAIRTSMISTTATAISCSAVQ